MDENIHNHLVLGDTGPLKDLIHRGGSPIDYIERSYSYSFQVQYEMIKKICPKEALEHTWIHPNFCNYTPKNMCDWAFLTLIRDCRLSFHDDIRDVDDLWAYHIIAEAKHMTLSKEDMWAILLNSFDGSSSWVRCLAAFLCNSYASSTNVFDPVSLRLGWQDWMTPNRVHILLKRIFPAYSCSTLSDALQKQTGEPLMMGLLKECCDKQTHGPCVVVKCIFDGKYPTSDMRL